VGLSDLRYWNNIYRNTIRIGQKLAIYVDPSKSDYYSKVNTMTFAEKQQMIGKTTPSNPVIAALQSGPDGDYITYTVRYGDTIWDIVKMFENVSTTDVLTLNNITDPGKIKVGQILKIRRRAELFPKMRPFRSFLLLLIILICLQVFLIFCPGILSYLQLKA